MEICFYPGSFDPFTNGHLHVVEKSAQLFDKVIIGIGINSSKSRRFDKYKMKNAIELMLKNRGLANVEVITYDNLCVDAALAVGAKFIVRGIRNGFDYDYEENLASINEEISGLDTIYIRAGLLGSISSSMVVDLMRNNRDVSKYLPKEIMKAIEDEIL